jgi:hypothetical protein
MRHKLVLAGLAMLCIAAANLSTPNVARATSVELCALDAYDIGGIGPCPLYGPESSFLCWECHYDCPFSDDFWWCIYATDPGECSYVDCDAYMYAPE